MGDRQHAICPKWHRRRWHMHGGYHLTIFSTRDRTTASLSVPFSVGPSVTTTNNRLFSDPIRQCFPIDRRQPYGRPTHPPTHQARQHSAVRLSAYRTAVLPAGEKIRQAAACLPPCVNTTQAPDLQYHQQQDFAGFEDICGLRLTSYCILTQPTSHPVC
ncbi:uncharacterized protein LOC144922213 [Branchiostoma floridae x Branchiostoma belcheri]